MDKLIFILCIDALDYDLVEEIGLNNLKQLNYGKIVVPINKKIGLPISTEVWASFLTGRHISKSFENYSIYINILLKISDFFNITIASGIGKKVKDFLKKLGFNAPIRFGSLNKKTFLDITNSMEINLPFYSFDNKTFDIGYLFGTGKLSLKQTIKEIDSIYEMRKIQIINEIDNIGNKDIIFAYVHSLDMLQHLLFLNIKKIEQYYIDLDYYVSILKRKIKKSFGDVIFIIVSDHGFDFDKGTHSMNGFYSSNTPLIPKPEKITDFYGIILKIK